MGSDLQTARYDRLVRRVGGIIGPGSKVTEALSELFPILDLENLPHELLVLSNTQTVFSTLVVAASVGEVSGAQLFNPANSATILIASTVWVGSAGVTTNIDYELTETPVAGPFFSGQFRDTRSGFGLESAGKVSAFNSAPLAARGRFRVSAVESFILNDSDGIAVLAPGTGLSVATAGFNLPINITFFWREREALQSELNF